LNMYARVDKADFLAQKTADSQIEILDESPYIMGVRRATNVNDKAQTLREIYDEAGLPAGVDGKGVSGEQGQGDRGRRETPGQARKAGDGVTRSSRLLTGDLFEPSTEQQRIESIDRESGGELGPAGSTDRGKVARGLAETDEEARSRGAVARGGTRTGEDRGRSRRVHGATSRTVSDTERDTGTTRHTAAPESVELAPSVKGPAPVDHVITSDDAIGKGGAQPAALINY